MLPEALILGQANMRTFVMVNAAYTEVAGLGGGFTILISKAGGPAAPGVGAKAEIVGMNGWYSYVFTAAECNTIGPLSALVTGAGCIQQNLEYIVFQPNYGCISFDYTVTNSVTLALEEGVEVWFSLDNNDPPTQVVWYGVTDVFGIARDVNGDVPCLDAGTYYVWKKKAGFLPDFWPDTEIVSP